MTEIFIKIKNGKLLINVARHLLTNMHAVPVVHGRIELPFVVYTVHIA